MDSKQIARALGASRTQALADRDAQGPLGLLQLRKEHAQRLHQWAATDRPATGDDMRRVIPFDPTGGRSCRLCPTDSAPKAAR